jgi:hypothetical protein
MPPILRKFGPSSRGSSFYCALLAGIHRAFAFRARVQVQKLPLPMTCRMLCILVSNTLPPSRCGQVQSPGNVPVCTSDLARAVVLLMRSVAARSDTRAAYCMPTRTVHTGSLGWTFARRMAGCTACDANAAHWHSIRTRAALQVLAMPRLCGDVRTAY